MNPYCPPSSGDDSECKYQSLSVLDKLMLLETPVMALCCAFLASALENKFAFFYLPLLVGTFGSLLAYLVDREKIVAYMGQIPIINLSISMCIGVLGIIVVDLLGRISGILVTESTATFLFQILQQWILISLIRIMPFIVIVLAINLIRLVRP